MIIRQLKNPYCKMNAPTLVQAVYNMVNASCILGYKALKGFLIEFHYISLFYCFLFAIFLTLKVAGLPVHSVGVKVEEVGMVAVALLLETRLEAEALALL